MSVLIAYGTQNYATIMSDSRATMYKDDQRNEFVGYRDDAQKIYKITDKFILGSAGSGSIHSWVNDVKPENPNSSFYNIRNYSYEEFLKFFIKRLSLSENLKKQYCVIVTAGVNSQNKITMDIMYTPDLNPITVQPTGDEINNKIFLPSNIPENYEFQFSSELKYQNNKEVYCESVIREIADRDPSVNKTIQKLTVYR